ncbi:hypothetical protein [Microbacterium sp.]|uniref:hypothetical protein n=1 Tax=Microbacterium sp. TaxID=51671 RepID=UPI003F9A80A5
MLRTLPILIEPVAGEICDGYIDRLAATHLLDVPDIRRELIRHIGRQGWNSSDSRLPDALAQLAGLPLHALTPSFEEHGMWVRCGHPAWSPKKCARCRRFDTPRTACTLCAGGLPTLTIARGGAYCTRHAQWSFRDLHATIPETDEYEWAERQVKTTLWERGVTLHTGEINLAAALVRAWNDGTPEPCPLHTRSERFGLASPRSYEETLLCAYPDVIRVATLITTRRVITPLLDTAVSALTQADRFTVAVAAACGGHPNEGLRMLARAIVGYAHRSVHYAAGLRRTPQTKNLACPMNRALIVAAGRQRACLLRHATPAQIRDTGWKRTGGAPRPRATRNRPLQPDELALP